MAADSNCPPNCANFVANVVDEVNRDPGDLNTPVMHEQQPLNLVVSEDNNNPLSQHPVAILEQVRPTQDNDDTRPVIERPLSPSDAG